MQYFDVCHYNDVIMGAMASQITSLIIVYSTVYSNADQRKHQSSASLAFVRGIHRWLVNSPHKWPATRKMFPSDDVIMIYILPGGPFAIYGWASSKPMTEDGSFVLSSPIGWNLLCRKVGVISIKNYCCNDLIWNWCDAGFLILSIC